MQPCECWSEGINSFPWPAGFAVASADCCDRILWYGHTVASNSIRYSAGLLPTSGREECAGHLAYGVRYLSWKEPYQISQRLFRDISIRLLPQVCKHAYITWTDSWCCRMCAHTAFVGAASACVTLLMHTSGTESHLASVPRHVSWLWVGLEVWGLEGECSAVHLPTSGRFLKKGTSGNVQVNPPDGLCSDVSDLKYCFWVWISGLKSRLEEKCS